MPSVFYCLPGPRIIRLLPFFCVQLRVEVTDVNDNPPVCVPQNIQLDRTVVVGEPVGSLMVRLLVKVKGYELRMVSCVLCVCR